MTSSIGTPNPAAVLHDLISYIDADATEWKPIEDGARRRTLHYDPETGRRIVLVQWDPGYTLSYRDEHAHDEFLYILSGTFVDQNRTSGPGTFIHNEPGSWHQPTTPDGVTYLAMISPQPGAGSGSGADADA
jgi:anti-sigma factor ChrR (cupin superfamily)